MATSSSSAAIADAPSWGCLKQLQILELDATRIGRSGCRALHPLRGHLTSLHIGGPLVDDAACIATARQGTSLKCLHLTGTLITQRGLDALKALWGLEELRIWGCAFMKTLAQAEFVSELPRLKVQNAPAQLLPDPWPSPWPWPCHQMQDAQMKLRELACDAGPCKA